MTDKRPPLYPLRFEPIYQYRLWGGRRLAGFLSTPLPGDGPIGEAWLLSDRDDHPSRIAGGPLKGQTLAHLFHQSPGELMGRFNGRFPRFPLLLKLLDVQGTLSVQVHPSDRQTDYIPAGEGGKTEAWVVIEAGEKGRIYAGLTPGTTEDDLQKAIAAKTVADHLASFQPVPGDAVLVRAGTVHSLSDVVVFEVQENSDVTYRLDDWDHVDPRTGKHRDLQVEQALACLDFQQVAVRPVVPVVEKPTPPLRERLVHCEHFNMDRLNGSSPFDVGEADTPHVLVCLAGDGQLDYGGSHHSFSSGDVTLLPAVVGVCRFRPQGNVTLLDLSLPEGA